jgi:HK97 gp10 family phage protein
MAKFFSALVKSLLGGGGQSRRFKKTRSRRQKRFTGGKGEGAYYGWFLEFGTNRHAPQPFLLPALEQNRARAEAVFIAEVKRGVDRLVGELGKK